jgi:uncharacterized protein
MNKKAVLKKTEDYVKKKFEADATGHDWWHVRRVFRNASTIAKREKGADIFIVKLGALLHDIADFKFHGGDDVVGGKVAKKWLKSIGVDNATTEKIVHIVNNVSFKGVGVASKMESLEGKIVQDADRLDAIGAIGIARTFAYGGHMGRPMYNPEGKTRNNKSFEEYKKGAPSTIHHFYEKLLHVRELMNTKTGKKIAIERHRFLEMYLERFYLEWRGVK